MDAVIVTLHAWILDWQQTAIANTRYTVVVIALSLFASLGIMWLWQRSRTATWLRQISALQASKTQLEQDIRQRLEERDQQREQAEQKITVLDEQRQASQLQLTQAEHQIKLLQQTIQEKEETNSSLLQQLNDHNAQLNSAQMEIEQLQRQLAEQAIPANIQTQLDDWESQHQADQNRLLQMEQEKVGFTNELEQINKQLRLVEDELAQKNAVINRMEQQPQLGEQKSVEQQHELEALRTQLQETEGRVRKAAELEQYFQQYNEQLLQINRHLNDVLPVEETASTANDGAGQGFFSKLLALVRKIDNNVGSAMEDSKEPEQTTATLLQEHNQLIERLLFRLQTQDLSENPDLSAQSGGPEPLANDVDDSIGELPRKVKAFYRQWLSK